MPAHDSFNLNKICSEYKATRYIPKNNPHINDIFVNIYPSLELVSKLPDLSENFEK